MKTAVSTMSSLIVLVRAMFERRCASDVTQGRVYQAIVIVWLHGSGFDVAQPRVLGL